MKTLTPWSKRRLAIAATAAAFIAILGIVPWRVVAQEPSPTPQAQSSPPAGTTASPMPARTPTPSPSLRPVENQQARFTGIVSAATAEIRAPLEGSIAEVEVKEGQTVKKGELLIRMSPSRDLQLTVAIDMARINVAKSHVEIAKSKYDQALASQAVATITATDVKVLAAEVKAAEAELAANETMLSSDRARLDTGDIRSPCDGVVTLLDLGLNQYVTANTLLTTVVNVSQLKVDVPVPTAQAATLKLGQGFTFVPTDLPNDQCAGEITYISPIANSATGDVTVRGLITKKSPSLRPGLHAVITFAEK